MDIESLMKRFIINIKLATSLVLIASLLTGCGFKLRGDYLLAPELQTLYVSSVDKHGELTRLFKKHLTMNNVKILPSYQVGKAEVRILKDTLDRRTLSLFSNGQVAEYELIYTVRYQIRIEDKEPQNFIFELNRDYQDDPNVALAKSRELSLMLSEMRLSAVDKILRGMASVQL